MTYEDEHSKDVARYNSTLLFPNRAITRQEAIAIVRASQGPRPPTGMGKDERKAYDRGRIAQAETHITKLIAKGLLIENADGTLRRDTAARTVYVWMNDETGHEVAVPQAQAAAEAARIRDARRAQSPEAKRQLEVDALRAQLERLEAAGSR